MKYECMLNPCSLTSSGAHGSVKLTVLNRNHTVKTLTEFVMKTDGFKTGWEPVNPRFGYGLGLKKKPSKTGGLTASFTTGFLKNKN